MNPRNGSDVRGAGGSDSGDNGRMLVYKAEGQARPSAWVRSLVSLLAAALLISQLRLLSERLNRFWNHEESRL